MAPSVPEEVDVFTIPHSRMKGLVNGYFDMLKSTNFYNDVDMENFLQNLLNTFMEFKTHEQIENRFIMKRLKNKLRRLSIQNTAVCNCHKDDQLGQMMRLIKDGYKKKTAQDRYNYGLMLKQELEDFTQVFLPHMQEEEEVFQPLLLKYFTYEELCQLKEKVIQEHVIQEQARSMGLEKDIAQELTNLSSSSEEEVEKCASEEEEEEESATTIEALPDEILSTVFTYLSPRDLGRAAQVCRHWNQAALEPTLWRNVLPVQWAQGDWDFHDNHPPDDDEDDAGFDEEEEGYVVIDDDADVDESEVAEDDVDSYNDVILQIQREGRVVSGLARYVLPRVGVGVHRLSLRNSRAITNGMMNKLLQHCPNLEYLDLTQTRVGDAGLKSLGKRGVGQKLKKVIFSGCTGVSDATMVRLAVAMKESGPSNQNQDGCPRTHIQDGCCKTRIQDGNQIQNNCCRNQNQDGCCRNEFQDGNGIQDGCCRNQNQGESPSNHKVADKNHRKEEQQCLCEEYYNTYSVEIENGCHVRESWNNQRCGEYRSRKQVVDEEKDAGSEKALKAKSEIRNEDMALQDTVTTHREMPTQHTVTADGGVATRDAITAKGDIILIPQVNGSRDVKNTGAGDGANYDSGQTASANNTCHARNSSGDVLKTYVIKTNETKDRDQRPGGQRSQYERSDQDCDSHDSNAATYKNGCHARCVSLKSWNSIEDCATPQVNHRPNELKPLQRHNQTLEYLDLSGCYHVTDIGLSALASSSLSFTRLSHIDVSGCLTVTGSGLAKLVSRCPALAPADLFYCDNVRDGPYPDSASGCRNVDCGKRRMCCRAGEIM